MKLLSYDGYTFSSGGFSANLADTFNRSSFDVGLRIQPRDDADPLILGGATNPRVIDVVFLHDGSGGLSIEDAFSTLLGKLRPRSNPAGGRILTAQRNDGTVVQARAAVTLPGGWDADFDVNTLRVTFTVRDLGWKAVAESRSGPTSFAAANSTTFTVAGFDDVLPSLRLGWVDPRPTPTSTRGWTYRRKIVVTNNGPGALHNYPLQLGPINLAQLVADGKLQSDGDDLYAFNDKGKRLRHGIAGTNTRGGFLWWVVDELPAGKSRTYDLCYGNSAATRDTTNNGFPYTYPGSPAIDTTAIDGQATSGAASTISTGLTLDDKRFAGSTILLVAASGAAVAGGQYRRLSSHTTLGVLTVSRAWTTNPDTLTGYVVVGCGFMGDGGQASATSSTTLTDSSQAWGTNEWVGATVEIITLNSTTGVVVQSAIVTGNSGTQLVVASWPSGTPSSTALYRVYRRNGNWIWRVNQATRTQTTHRGRWRLSAGASNPASIWEGAQGAPAAWSRTTYNPLNAQNDFNQRSVTANAGDYYALLNASIARKDGARLTEEGFANGCEISNPLGFLGVKHDLKLLNPSGMANAVFGTRERGGQDWTKYREDSATLASLTLRSATHVDLTPYGTPRHLLAALTSDDGADIESTQTGTANLTDGDVLEARIDTRNLVVTRWEDAVEETVYDYTLTVRRGAASELPGDDLVIVAGEIEDEERHVFLTARERLWVGPIGDIPYAARIVDDLFTDDSERDSFTDSNGTNLEAHVPDTAGTWTNHATASGAGSNVINNNRTHNPNSSTTHVYYHDKTPVSADYDVTADVVMRSDNNLSSAGVAGRIATGAATYYAARYLTNGNVWALTKVVAGSATTLASVGATLVVDQAYEVTLCLRGSWLRVLVDGVVILNEIDADVTAAGKAGLITHEAATSSTGVHLDNWSFADAWLNGTPTYVRDVPAGVQVLHVDEDHTGDEVRNKGAQVLPLSPGSTTLRVSDDEGNIGTVTVETVYTPAYL